MFLADQRVHGLCCFCLQAEPHTPIETGGDNNMRTRKERVNYDIIANVQTNGNNRATDLSPNLLGHKLLVVCAAAGVVF